MCRTNCTGGEQGRLHIFREEMTVQKSLENVSEWCLFSMDLNLVEFCCLSLLSQPDMISVAALWHVHHGNFCSSPCTAVLSTHTGASACTFCLANTDNVFLKAFLAIPLRFSAAKQWVEPTQQEQMKSSFFLTDFLVTLSLWGRSQRGQLNHWENVACLFCCFVA